MRVAVLILSIGFVAFATSQGSIEDAFAKQIRVFSGQLYKAALAGNGAKNLIYSPLSVFETLGMILAGSQGNTTRELLQGMEITQDDLPGVDEPYVHGLMYLLRTRINREMTGQTLLVANAMFVHQDFALKDTYVGTLSGKYGAHYESLNLANSEKSSTRINQWVSENTGGKIQELVKAISPLTRVILINAVYFNASWKHSFSDARLMNYTLSDGTVVRREAMTLQSTFLYKMDIRSRMEFLAIPYASRTAGTSYFIVGLSFGELTAFDQMAGETLEAFGDISKWRNVSRLLQLPKFEIAAKLNLKPILQELGISQIFDEERSNLAGISNTQLYVSEIVHKASVTVNEEGTEASAATMVSIEERSGTISKSFKVDRPFFFGIYNEQAKIFTFVGKINDPNQGQL